MSKEYDTVFVTHLPAFYKVNLYNELAKQARVFVIFIASASVIRAKDFTPHNFAFDYCILNEGAFETRSRASSLWRLYQLLKTLTYRQIIVGGWDLWEFWLIALLSPQKRNALACESSVYESRITGLAGWLKRTFLKRMHLAYCSGKPQKALLKALSFDGVTKETLGVGIFNYAATPTRKPKAFSGKFLYVGRLSPEKNLISLVNLFAHYPQYQLTLIGQGPLHATLQANVPSNVTLVGHVPNETLSSWYQSHDIFILPSLKEPWGLVVEEALFYGLPVIASENVGCAQDFINHYQVGKLFSPNNEKSFSEALKWCANNYQQLLDNVQKIDFQARDVWQVKQYL